MKRLLRLFVMMSIKTPEEVFKTAAKTGGLDIENMDAEQVAACKAFHKSIEADYMIYFAFNHGFIPKDEMKQLAFEIIVKTRHDKD